MNGSETCFNFADVVVQVDAIALNQPLTYSVPDETNLAIGDCVQVPLRAGSVLGHVVKLHSIYGGDMSRVKPILGRIEGAAAFNEDLLAVAQHVANYTVSSLRDSLKLIAPEVLSSQIESSFSLCELWDTLLENTTRSEIQRKMAEYLMTQGGASTLKEITSKFKPVSVTSAISELRRKGIVRETRVIVRPKARDKKIRMLCLNVEIEVAKTEAADLHRKRASRQSELLETLVTARISASNAFALAGVAVSAEQQSAAKALAAKGLAVYVETTQRRNPYLDSGSGSKRPDQLSDLQTSAITKLNAAADAHVPHVFLLHGVTGSGKTEIYLHTVEHVLKNGHGAIVVLPEIALTAQVLALFKTRLGDENVAVLHSSLSLGERHDEWQRIKSGQARVVIGPRSAIFAPITNLRLIIMDEEHDGSYKQDSNPRYHARDAAEFRAKQSKAVIVLGSATPSIESRFKAENGTYTLLSLPERIDNRPLPTVSIVDLRQQFAKPISRKRPSQSPDHASTVKEDAPGIFGQQLKSALALRLDRGEQSILFLNRRGFASFLLCRDCGFSYQCPNCDVSLTYHSTGKLLQCHHCDHRQPAGDICPKCGGLRLRPFGLGTEKVEQSVTELLPHARVLRMDRDTMTKKGSHEHALGLFRRGEADILIGTQIVAKGLDFPQVTLVGVVTADSMLNIPDFRTAERSFQLLTQVAGRAGRGKKIGEVIIQTFTPEHPSVLLASQHNYARFYETELEVRREVAYPPFVHLANIVFSDDEDKQAYERIHKFMQVLKTSLATLNVVAEILGPTTCPIPRLRNRYRWHVLVKCRDRTELVDTLTRTVSNLDVAARNGMSLDIDPMSML